MTSDGVSRKPFVRHFVFSIPVSCLHVEWLTDIASHTREQMWPSSCLPRFIEGMSFCFHGPAEEVLISVFPVDTSVVVFSCYNLFWNRLGWQKVGD